MQAKKRCFFYFFVSLNRFARLCLSQVDKIFKIPASCLITCYILKRVIIIAHIFLIENAISFVYCN